ncbi:hypothetical protein ACFVYA_41500 [Amycolatopsis sp. NPDC058278]|uniref:hypothetical protein n=1 Tax=Amycolatopsis sp. NPDC058278 TaxID=3346417 RepID=UPI0036DEF8A9
MSWDVTKNIVRPGSAQPQTTAPPSLADTDEAAVAALERKAQRQPINHTKIMAYAALITT